MNDYGGNLLQSMRQKFVFSVQVDPPDPDENPFILPFMDDCWKRGANAVDINTSKLVPSVDSLVLAQLVLASGHPICPSVIPHVAVRDNGITGLVNRVYSLYRCCGLRSVLVVQGDDYKEGQGTGYDDSRGITSAQVIAALHEKLRHAGICPDLLIAAAFNQNNPLDEELKKAFNKKQAGADLFMTQPVFTVPQLEAVRAVADSHNLGKFMIGVFPLPYRKVFKLVRDGGIKGVMAPDELLAEGEALCAKKPLHDKNLLLRDWTLRHTLEVLSAARAMWSPESSIGGVYIVTPRKDHEIVPQLLAKIDA